MFENETFIRSYNNVLPDHILSEVMKISSYCEGKGKRGGYAKRNNGETNDHQTLLEPFWPGVALEISNAVFDKMFSHYMKEFYFIKDINAEWMNGSCLLQKTSVGGGYHAFHTENLGWINTYRLVAWMIYLNDVEEGGETEFPMQHKKIKPTKNTGLIWPGGLTHFHRGNPPYSNDKYVLTGWLALSGDTQVYSLKVDGKK